MMILKSEEQEPDRKRDLQQARRVLEKIVLADPSHQILTLLHADEDCGDADGEQRDEGYAPGAPRHVAEAVPPPDEAAKFDGERRRKAAPAQPERDRAFVVGVPVSAVVGENDQLARFFESVRASRPDREGRAWAAPDLADQPEPRLAWRARLDLQRIEEEIAIALGAAMDKAVRP
jgi:hypothetical protein